MVTAVIVAKNHGPCFIHIMFFKPRKWHCIINFSTFQMRSLGLTEIISFIIFTLCDSIVLMPMRLELSLDIVDSREKAHRLLLKFPPFCGLTIPSSLDSLRGPKTPCSNYAVFQIKNHNNILIVKELKAG